MLGTQNVLLVGFSVGLVIPRGIPRGLRRTIPMFLSFKESRAYLTLIEGITDRRSHTGMGKKLPTHSRVPIA